MAIEILRHEEQLVDAGIFNVPPSFDRLKYAAAFIEEGQVEFARQRQSMPGLGATIDGWQPWRPTAKDKPYIVTTGNKKRYVLMCRDRKLQDQANAMYGNASKKAVNREITGETVAGEVPRDSGILSGARLPNSSRSEVEESIMPLNPIEELQPAET